MEVKWLLILVADRWAFIVVVEVVCYPTTAATCCIAAAWWAGWSLVLAPTCSLVRPGVTCCPLLVLPAACLPPVGGTDHPTTAATPLLLLPHYGYPALLLVIGSRWAGWCILRPVAAIWC